MDYLLKASGLVIIFFLFYYIFLKNETFFKSIRSYFLIGLIVAVSIPLVEIPVYVEAVTQQFNSSDFNIISNTPIVEQSFDWIQILTFTYLVGIVFFSLKFLLQLISLAFLLSKHELSKKGKYYFIETSKNISPFSFFNII
ncbi:MAG: M56 family peptidase, partial [Bacteroidetes bacterium]|nr:M56 family peptidase [Bacteroidota bacterium]